jgi:hypothetical protein
MPRKKAEPEVTVDENGVLDTGVEEISEEVVVEESEATDVAVVPQGGAVANVTDRKGFEHVDLTTVKLPTAKLLQALSPEVVEEEYEDLEFKAGDIVHSILLEVMEPKFIPIMIFEDNIMFSPRKTAEQTALVATVKKAFGEDMAAQVEEAMKEGNLVCRSKDGKKGDLIGAKCAECPLSKFQGNDKPWCTRNINVLALFEGQELPVIIRFSNTSYKHGQRFKNQAFYAGGNLFDRMYSVKKKTNKNDDKTWFEMTVRPAGKPDPDSEMYQKAVKFHEMYLNVVLEAEGVEEQDTPPAQETTQY